MKPSKRKFYRTVVQVEVLSETPFNYDDLEGVHYAITSGDCSGLVTDVVTNQELDGPAAAELLSKQGSDPGFFGLNEDGSDADDNEGV